MADPPNDRPRWIQRIVRRVMHDFHDPPTGEEPEEAYLVHWGDTNQRTYHRAVEIRRDYPQDVATHYPQFYELENGQLHRIYLQSDHDAEYGSGIGSNEGSIVNIPRRSQPSSTISAVTSRTSAPATTSNPTASQPPSQLTSTTSTTSTQPSQPFKVVRCAECVFAHKKCVGPVPTCERCIQYGISADKCFYKSHGRNKKSARNGGSSGRDPGPKDRKPGLKKRKRDDDDEEWGKRGGTRKSLKV